MVGANVIVRLVNFFVGLVETLLGLRIILKLLGANPGAPFVNWIYEISLPLLTPFIGMFPTPSLEMGSVIEFSALFAVVIYALGGYLIVELLATLEAGSEKRIKTKK